VGRVLKCGKGGLCNETCFVGNMGTDCVILCLVSWYGGDSMCDFMFIW